MMISTNESTVILTNERTWLISPEVPQGDVPVPAGQDEDISSGGLDTPRMLGPAAWRTLGNTENI